MRHPGLLDRHRAVLLLIDLQEAYRPVLHGWDGVRDACAVLVRGASILELPLLVTEQYPRGLGRTAAEVAAHFRPGQPVLEKLSMSCCGSQAFMDALAASGRKQVLVAGIETHACVNQTVHDLIAAGYQVHVARDATSSRQMADATVAWERMRGAGMLATTSEQALLELVRTAEAPEFRPLQRLLKERGASGADVSACARPASRS
ncbi:MAG TPA: hydrolase [Candidatus Binatia bacterium]|nr:hydrolase [Candidatus Binatia bacterium]